MASIGTLKKYAATVGLNFDGLKDKPRVEIGEIIPVVSEAEIKQLLADGMIEEVKDDRPKHNN